MDKDIALKIIANSDDFSLGQGDYTKQNLWELIVENYDVFDGLKIDEELAIWMLDHKREIVFGRTIGKFQGLGKAAALKYIKNNGYFQFMEKESRHFKWMDRDVAVALMDSSIYEAQDILDNLGRFQNTTPNKVAHYIKDKKDQYYNAKTIINHIDKYSWLDAEIKAWFISDGHQKEVERHPEAFAA